MQSRDTVKASASFPSSGQWALHCAAMMGHHLVLVLSQNTKCKPRRKVQSGNIDATKTIAYIIQTCLGPKSMMKMLLDTMGGIVMTNDGNDILWKIQVQHPASKSMTEISWIQDEEVGDGTISVIILAREMLSVAEHFLEKQMHQWWGSVLT